MGCMGRHLAACLLACGLGSPAVASVLAPHTGADVGCAQQSGAAGGCPGGATVASADAMADIGLSAQPLPGSVESVRAAVQSRAVTAAQVRISEIASFLVSDRGAGSSADPAAPALFWVLGTGLLGAAFVARRRKPTRAARP